MTPIIQVDYDDNEVVLEIRFYDTKHDEEREVRLAMPPREGHATGKAMQLAAAYASEKPE